MCIGHFCVGGSLFLQISGKNDDGGVFYLDQWYTFDVISSHQRQLPPTPEVDKANLYVPMEPIVPLDGIAIRRDPAHASIDSSEWMQDEGWNHAVYKKITS